MANRLNTDTNLGLYSALSAVKPDSSETPVQMLWQVIIPTEFPPAEGFKYGFKDPVLATGHIPDVVVFQVFRTGIVSRGSTDLIEKQILFIECKPPYMDTPTEWESTGSGQLVDYMLNSTNRDPHTRAFAGVAIGTKVKFLKFDATATPMLQPLHEGTHDMHDRDGRINVERWLGYIKQQGWAWAR